MAIRAPSTSLAPPNITTLRSGAMLHRIHDRNYAANVFNPCQGGATRFAPISDGKGQCVASLYAGNTIDCAIFETVFHDVPANAKLKTIPRRNVQSRAHGALRVLRDLKLATLRNADLKKWSITRAALITSSPKLYSNTAAWAEAIHHQFPNVDGLIWTSNQCDPDNAYLFFGDRVAASDFAIVTARDGRSDPTLMADIRSAGRRSGISITI